MYETVAPATLALARTVTGLLLLGVILAAPAVASAQKTDKLVLRNGDELTGEVKSLASGRLSFKTDATSTIDVEWNYVAQLTSSNFFEVVADDGRRFFGPLLEPEDPGTLRVGTEASAFALSLGDVARIERIRQTFWSRLKGSADLGFSLYKSNERRELSVNFESNYRTRQGAWSLSLNSLYRKQDNSEDLDRQNVTFGYRRFLDGNWLVGGFASGQRNTELALDLRFIVGALGGYHIVRTVEQDLVAIAGIDAAEENFLDDRERTESIEAFVGLNYTLYALGARDFTVNTDAAVYPSLSVKGRVRVEINANIRKEIISDFYVSLNGFFSSDNSSGDGEDQGATTDYGSTIGVGYSW